MATVILNHKVEDYNKWRPFFDADLPRRKAAGMKNERVFRSAEDPNNVYIIGEITDPISLERMMTDPDLGEKMKAAGVLTKPFITLMDEA